MPCFVIASAEVRCVVQVLPSFWGSAQLMTTQSCKDTALSVQFSTCMRGYLSFRCLVDIPMETMSYFYSLRQVHFFFSQRSGAQECSLIKCLLSSVHLRIFPCNSLWDNCAIRWKCQRYINMIETHIEQLYKAFLPIIAICIIFRHCTIFTFHFLIMDPSYLILFYFAGFFFSDSLSGIYLHS